MYAQKIVYNASVSINSKTENYEEVAQFKVDVWLLILQWK